MNNKAKLAYELAEKLDNGERLLIDPDTLIMVLERSNFVHFDIVYDNETGMYFIQVI